MALHIFLLYSYVVGLHIIQPSHSLIVRPSFTACSEHTSCGSILNIGYPFWGLGRPSICGRPELQLSCDNNFTILFGPIPYKVLGIDPSKRTITLRNDEFLLDNACPEIPLNTTLNSNLFSFNPNQNDVVNLTLLYDCPPRRTLLNNSNIISNFTCNGSVALAYYNATDRSNLGCGTRVEVPVFSRALKRLESKKETLLDVLNEGFRVEYRMDTAACAACEASGGACGSAAVSPDMFTCYCRYAASIRYPYRCPGRSKKKKILTGVGVGILGSTILLSALYFLCIRVYKKSRDSSTNTMETRFIPSSPHASSYLKNDHNYLGVKLFSYDELEEATNHFHPSKELGNGGFGTVYHAKIGDGREVAIKRLYDRDNNSKRVQQFINEIEILARLRHKNLVSLYGYSFQQSRELLLVFEYISNGTLADHLHGNKRNLTWHTRLSIAIETASALVYLHASDIIHRDVKTNNILLDNSFSVKVADFGLSRLFPLEVTHVSTSPQGTPGYVDPEYHQCYHLTDKSDVYSFGVVLAELLSSQPAVDISRHHREINLSNMAVRKIQNGLLPELVDSRLGFDSDSKVEKEMTRVAEVAFQCLQHDREMRPTMEEVLNILTNIDQENMKTKRAGDVLSDELDIQGDEAFRLHSELSPICSSPEGKGSASTSLSSC